jgi:hypothetical protein
MMQSPQQQQSPLGDDDALELSFDRSQRAFVLQDTSYLSSSANPSEPRNSAPHGLLTHVLDALALLLSDQTVYTSLRARLLKEMNQADEAVERARFKLHSQLYNGTAPAGSELIFPELDDGAPLPDGIAIPLREMKLLHALRTAEEEAEEAERFERTHAEEQEEDGTNAAEAKQQSPSASSPSSRAYKPVNSFQSRLDAAQIAALRVLLEVDAGALMDHHRANLALSRANAERDLQAYKKKLRLMPALQYAQHSLNIPMLGLSSSMLTAAGGSHWKP